jgi:hypothetical protein
MWLNALCLIAVLTAVAALFSAETRASKLLLQTVKCRK